MPCSYCGHLGHNRATCPRIRMLIPSERPLPTLHVVVYRDNDLYFGGLLDSDQGLNDFLKPVTEGKWNGSLSYASPKGGFTTLEVKGQSFRVEWGPLFQKLQEENFSVNQRNSKGSTLLNQACAKNYVHAVQLLLPHPEIDVNLQDETGSSPLCAACEHGNTKIVRLLLKDSRVNCALQDYAQHTPLWWASKNTHRDVIRMMIASGRTLNAHLGSKDRGVLFTPSDLWRGYNSDTRLLIQQFIEHPDEESKKMRNSFPHFDFQLTDHRLSWEDYQSFLLKEGTFYEPTQAIISTETLLHQKRTDEEKKGTIEEFDSTCDNPADEGMIIESPQEQSDSSLKTHHVIEQLRLFNEEEFEELPLTGDHRRYSFATRELPQNPSLDKLEVVFDSLVKGGLPLSDLLSTEGVEARDLVTSFHKIFAHLAERFNSDVFSLFPTTVLFHWIASTDFPKYPIGDQQLRYFDQYCALGIDPKVALSLCKSNSDIVGTVRDQFQDLLMKGEGELDNVLASFFSGWRSKELIRSTKLHFGESVGLGQIIETARQQLNFWTVANNENSYFGVKNRNSNSTGLVPLCGKDIPYFIVAKDSTIEVEFDAIQKWSKSLKTSTADDTTNDDELWYHCASEGRSSSWLTSEMIPWSHPHQDFGSTPSFWLYDSFQIASNHVIWMLESKFERIPEGQRPVVEIYRVSKSKRNSFCHWVVNPVENNDPINEENDSEEMEGIELTGSSSTLTEETEACEWKELVFNSRKSNFLGHANHLKVQKADSMDWVFGAQLDNSDPKDVNECNPRYNNGRMVMQLAVKNGKSLAFFKEGFSGMVLGSPNTSDKRKGKKADRTRKLSPHWKEQRGQKRSGHELGGE